MPGPPDLPGVVAAFSRADAKHVVIGGFAVIANRHVRATEDVDLLIPEDPDNHARVHQALEALGARLMLDGSPVTGDLLATRAHLRLDCGGHGIVDLLKEGDPPLDFASVSDDAIAVTVQGVPMRFAGLASLVALKRLAGRPRDRADLEELERIHGPLPMLPIPGLDVP
jgi:hypothetical protein